MNRSSLTVMRKERRRDRRRALQIEASLDGESVVLTDLSAAGFGAAVDATSSTNRVFRLGRRGRLELNPGSGDPLSLAVEITRPVAENGVFGGVFVGLSDEAYNLIEALLTGRLRRRR